MKKPNQPNLTKYDRPAGLALAPHRVEEILELHGKGYDNGQIAVYAEVKVSLVVATLQQHGKTPNPGKGCKFTPATEIQK